MKQIEEIKLVLDNGSLIDGHGDKYVQDKINELVATVNQLVDTHLAPKDVYNLFKDLHIPLAERVDKLEEAENEAD